MSAQRSEPGSVNIPVAVWPASARSEPGSSDVDRIVTRVVEDVNHGLETRDYEHVVAGFRGDGCYWRDHLASGWELRTVKGTGAILDFLRSDGGTRVRRLSVDKSNAFVAPQFTALDALGDVKGIQFFVTFTTDVGSGRGVVKLSEVDGEWKIWTVFLSLQELSGYEEPLHGRRGQGVNHGGEPESQNWLERRTAEQSLEDGSSPAVLIVGSGQGGLTAAARLKMLGVSALIVESNSNVGDNWRRRYRQLVLHDPVWYDHMPYLPFPAHWPIFTPKDKLASWFEAYAQLLELNVWTQTAIKSSSWDEQAREWTVTVERTAKNGALESRTLHPRHIIQATGSSGKKYFPSIDGLDSFKGQLLCHSSEFPGAKTASAGQKAVVVGACNSGHDIAQDYYEKGYDVTMVQRSSTCVVTSKAIVDIGLAGLYCEGGPATDDADMWFYGLPSEVLKALQFKVSGVQADHDKKILEGLSKVGFHTDLGPDDCGLIMKFLQRGGGYYIDVGASQLIADGKIKIKSGQEITEILADGLKFADGSTLQADELVFATGYQNMRTQTRELFGDAIADRVGDVWGFNEEGELRTIWAKSGHPGIWFQGGNLALCRYFSLPLALQIKAIEAGLCKYEDRR